MNGERYDIVIVGGAAMGSAVAYFLAADADFDGSVLVVERDPSYADSATARSWGGIRQQFTTPENIAMSLFGAAFVKAASEVLAVEGIAPDLAFHEHGYLTLAGTGGAAGLADAVALQNGLGAEIDLLQPEDLVLRFPWLDVTGLGAGAFGRRNEGWISPEALLHALRRKARSLGAVYCEATVTGLSKTGEVALSDGRTIRCGKVVIAAGSTSAEIAALAGIDVPVRRRKRTTYVFDCRAALPAVPPAVLPALPLTIDPTGLAFRPEGGQFIAILSPDESVDFDAEAGDLVPGDDFETILWPILAARVPAFEAVKCTGAWAGHYDVTPLDHNAIIGPHADADRVILCCGFSGHGLQHSPAAGRAVAELIVHGGFRALDLGALGYDRIARRTPLKESNIV